MGVEWELDGSLGVGGVCGECVSDIRVCGTCVGDVGVRECVTSGCKMNEHVDQMRVNESDR